jgi:DNA-binding transcriptional regulator YiaG
MTPEQRLDRIEAIIEKQSEEIDKHNMAIRDLIVVSRTVLTAVQESSVQIKELREAQAVTDEKLNILIDTVDRIVRHRDAQP